MLLHYRLKFMGIQRASIYAHTVHALVTPKRPAYKANPRVHSSLFLSFDRLTSVTFSLSSTKPIP